MIREGPVLAGMWCSILCHKLFISVLSLINSYYQFDDQDISLLLPRAVSIKRAKRMLFGKAEKKKSLSQVSSC